MTLPKTWFYSFLVTLGWSAFFLFILLDMQVDIARLRLQIPLLEKEVIQLREENMQLCYDIERFENPDHLMHLAQELRFSHLHYPVTSDVIILP